MQIEQQRSLGKQSMRIVGGKYEDGSNDFRELMLLHNKVEGIMKFEVINENGNKIYEYMMSPGTESLKSFCEHHKVRIDELRNIFGMLLKSVYHGHEFMLREDDYVVTPDTVYTDGKQRTEVAYFSGNGESLREQLKKLAEFVMDYVDYQDEDAVLLLYSLYMKTKDESCTIEDLVSVLNTKNGKNTEDTEPENEIGDKKEITCSNRAKFEEIRELQKREDVENRNNETGVNSKLVKRAPDPMREASELADHAAFREIVPDKSSVKPSPITVIKSAPTALLLKSIFIPVTIAVCMIAAVRLGALTNTKTGQADVLKVFACALAGLAISVTIEKRMWGRFSTAVEESFRTAAESANEPTLLLCDDGTARFPFSLVSDEYPSIDVGRVPFFVGKDPQNSDFTINKAGVSRFHMKIDKEGDFYVISDMCSTNGTYINGVRLDAYRPQKVKRGDEVRIGPVVYYCN